MRLTLHHAHAWDVPPAEAVAIQRRLAAEVRQIPLPQPPRTIAGVDMSVHTNLQPAEVQAAVAVLAYPGLETVAQARWRGPVQFPYVPGLLSFREVPAVLHALEQLDALPDLIMADAQGIAHPRRFGLAAHLGVLLDRPVLGVAKSRLTGAHDEPDDVRGATTPLWERDEPIGAVLRTRPGVKPLYISVGHRITLGEAVAWVVACLTRYRLPEPTRRAHLLSREGYA